MKTNESQALGVGRGRVEQVADILQNVKSIAILGASDHSFFAASMIHLLQTYHFPGHIFPVHPRETTAGGLKVYASLDELPEGPDLAAVVLRAESVLGAVEELYSRGCRVVMVISDGFAETNEPAGIAREAALVEFCRSHGVTLIGPNCVGMADFATHMMSLSGPQPEDIPHGSISMVSQSGALLGSIIRGFEQERIGIDFTMSIGNAADLSVVEVIDMMLQRDTTDLVCAYIEGYREVDRLDEVLARAQRLGKRVMILKTGESETSQQIAMSHTASIAGSAAFSEAFLARRGVVRVRSVEEFVQVAAIHRSVPDPGGVLVLTTSGGGAGLAADLAAKYGVPLVKFTAETEETLRELVPASGYVGNPMDMSGRVVTTGSVSVDSIYDVVLDDPDLKTVVFVATMGYPDNTPGRAGHRRQIEDVLDGVNRHGKRLIVSAVAKQSRTDWVDEMTERHPEIRFVSGLESTLAALGRLAEPTQLRRPFEPRPPRPKASSPAGDPQTVLDEDQGRRILQEVGLAVAPGDRADSPDAAAQVAAELGFPVVLKGVLPSVSHKSAIGGVVVGLCNTEGVKAAAEKMATTFATDDSPTLNGFLVERMVSGTEFILGLTRDRLLGPAMTFGLGGDLAETTSLNSTVLLPLGADDRIDRLFRQAGLDELLASLGPEAHASVIAYASTAADLFIDGALSSYDTVEINPLIVMRNGDAVAGDVVLVHGKP